MWQCPKCGRDFTKVNQGHSCGDKPETVDGYIAAQAEKARPILKKIRSTIKNAVPDATEKISWRMPAFSQGGNLLHFAAFKNHIGVYPGDLTPFAQSLSGYTTTKSAIHFPLDKPIDYGLIAEIARRVLLFTPKT